MALYAGIDVGGTFTDFVLADATGQVRIFKALSTPSDPTQAIRNGLALIEEETGITQVVDPWGGSYMMESLTNDIADRAWELFQEVEDKLFEETDYNLELKRSQHFAEECSHLPNVNFPHYYPEFSCEKIITMDWMSGIHFSEFTKKQNSQEDLNKIGQMLWDFYMYQMHILKKVHADPHPGNFLISENKELLVIDFGCIKEIPEDFYIPYFELAKEENLKNPEIFREKLFTLEILREEDSLQEKEFFAKLFYELLELFTRPFNQEKFDFSDESFFQEIADLGQKYAKASDMKGMNTNRGSRHFIYLNRTFFGLYNMMHDLKAKDVAINNFKNYCK